MSPEGLKLGQISLSWRPDAGKATVHFVRIIRNGTPIDVLASQKFEVIRREADLENSMLNGIHTATLQVAGLQVGDELEFAATIENNEKLLAGHPSDVLRFRTDALNGAHRMRLVWDEALPISIRPSPEMPAAKIETLNGVRSQTWMFNGPKELKAVDFAPPRLQGSRKVEYSAFANWGQLSAWIVPPYLSTSQLAPNSPLKAEAARIMATSDVPEKRAAMALELVRNQIRYVFVGLDGKNLVPVSADETWRNRFGDCKGKTVVLLALLREMGIEAEPVLVNTMDDDGLNESLPIAGLFNHVAARARINGKTYWMDGTQAGATDIAFLEPAPYRWMLPLRQSGAQLEAVDRTPLAAPSYLTAIDIDASAGVSNSAPTKVWMIFRGAEASTFRSSMLALNADLRDTTLKGVVGAAYDELTIEKVDWSFDAARSVLTIYGEGKLDDLFFGGPAAGYAIVPPDRIGTTPEEWERPKEQDQTLAWVNNDSKFACTLLAMHLPKSKPPFNWRNEGKTLHETWVGSEIWNYGWLQDRTLIAISSARKIKPEISADEVKAYNQMVKSFKYDPPTAIEDYPSSIRAKKVQRAPFPFLQRPFSEIDWTSPDVPCRAPGQ